MIGLDVVYMSNSVTCPTYMSMFWILRGGAPPVMDGDSPGIGPDVDLLVYPTWRWTRLSCLSLNGSIYMWSGSRQGCLTFYGNDTIAASYLI